MQTSPETLAEWCRRNKLCRTSFYNLKKRGEAPAFYKVGAKVLISPEADAQWRHEREADAAAKASSSEAA